MSLRYFPVPLVVMQIVACTVALEVPPQSEISCESKSDCPQDTVCDLLTGICRDPDLEFPAAPTLIVLDAGALVIERPLRTVTLSIDIADDNGAPLGQEFVDLEVLFSSDGGQTTCAATIDAAVSDPVTNIAVSRTGETRKIAWDALSDARAGACHLGVRSVDAIGNEDPLEADDIVDYQAAVSLHITAVDDSGEHGITQVVGPFAIGNTPPQAVLPEAFDGIDFYRGAVPIEFQLVDGQLDLSTVQLQYRVGDTGNWEMPLIFQGETQGLPSSTASASARAYVAVWDSSATAPRGVGDRRVRVDLRARAFDMMGSETHFGSWSAPVQLPLILNQTPPRITELLVPEASFDRGSGGVLITFQTVDEESDPVDVYFDYSFDGGMQWTACRELSEVRSEGRHGLATRPASSLEGSGVPHRFVWDTRGVHRGTPPDSALLRAIVSDGKPDNLPQGTGTEVFAPIGPRGVSPYDLPKVTDTTVRPTVAEFVVLSASADPVMVIGAPDAAHLALWQPQSDGTFVRLSQTEDFCVSPVGKGILGATHFDVDGDGADELFVLCDAATNYEIYLADAQSFAAGAVSLVATAAGRGDPRSIDHVNLDGSGPHELVVGPWIGSGIDVFWLEPDGSLDRQEAITTCDSNIEVGVLQPPTGFPGGITASCAAEDKVQIFQYAIGVFSSVDITESDLPGPAILSSPGAMVSGFVNDDQFIDLVVANRTEATLTFFAGNATGLTWAGQFAVRTPPDKLTIADADNDGDNDIIALSFGKRLVAIIFGAEDPSGLDLQIPLPQIPISAGVVDFNNDGFNDLAIATARLSTVGTDPLGLLIALPWAPRGEISDGALVDTDIDVGEAALGIYSTDATDDGIPDLLVYRPTAPILPDIGVFGGLGLPAFGQGRYTIRGAGRLLPDEMALVLGDFDANGRLDVIAASSVFDGLALLSNSVSDGVSVGRLVRSDIVPTFKAGAVKLASGDLDGDGRDDLMVLRHGPTIGSRVETYLSTDTGASGSETDSTALIEPPLSIVAGDFDSDGHLDVLVGLSPSRITLLHGAGDGTLAALTTTNISVAPDFLVPGDFDDDGLLDVLIAGTTPSRLLVATQDPSGDFIERAFDDSEIDGALSRPAIADINGDGALDIIVGVGLNAAGLGSPAVHIYRNTVVQDAGSAAFAWIVSEDDLAPVGGVVAYDANGDGLVDIAATNREGSEMTLLAGQNAALAIRDDPSLAHELEVATTVEKTVKPTLVVSPEQDLPFEQNRFHTIPSWPFTRRLVRTLRGSRETSFIMALRRTPLRPTTRLSPITRAYFTGGQRHMRTVPREQLQGQICGDRVRVEERYGPEVVSSPSGAVLREGLDASLGRGIVLALPLDERSLQRGVSGTVRVYRRVLDWVRADEMPEPALASDGASRVLDPLRTASEGGHYLPQLALESGACTDVVKTQEDWSSIPQAPGNDITQGTGERFEIDPTGFVILFVDRLGELQAFEER